MNFSERNMSLGHSSLVPEKPPQRTGPIARTPAGLRDALIDEIDGLRDGSRNPQHTIAVCNAAKQIVASMRVEFDCRKQMGDSARVIDGVAND